MMLPCFGKGAGRGKRQGGPRVITACGLLAIMALYSCSEAGEWRTGRLGNEFPDLKFELVGERGEPITEQRLRGQVVLLFFGYTHCPDVCPTTLARLRSAIEALAPERRARIRVLLVSVDPARDDPARLAAYTDSFGEHFIGATAELDRIRKIANRYGASFSIGSRDGNGFYTVTHGSSVLVFDEDGSARLLVRQDDNVDAIAHDLRRLLSS